MRQNIFEIFLNKVFNVPLWIRHVMYLKLMDEMQNQHFEDFIRTHKDELFSTYVPTLTFIGKTELTDRKCGLDNNTYNFLQCCANEYSILEISINTFLSLEEVAKYYELCVEQNFIKKTESKEIIAMAGFISGKYRIGEYFKQRGTINVDQLQQAILADREQPDKKFGEILVQLGYISEEQLKAVVTLKEEAQKRFILDYNIVPQSGTEYKDTDKKYENEINLLKEENLKLKKKMLQLLELVKKNAN